MDFENQKRLLIRVNDLLNHAIGALSCIPLEDDLTAFIETDGIRTGLLSLATMLDLRTRTDTPACVVISPPCVTAAHVFAAISCCDDLEEARRHLAGLQASTSTYYDTLAIHLNSLLLGKKEGSRPHCEHE